jgi:hypothetical protein
MLQTQTGKPKTAEENAVLACHRSQLAWPRTLHGCACLSAYRVPERSGQELSAISLEQ